MLIWPGVALAVDLVLVCIPRRAFGNVGQRRSWNADASGHLAAKRKNRALFAQPLLFLFISSMCVFIYEKKNALEQPIRTLCFILVKHGIHNIKYGPAESERCPVNINDLYKF